MRIKREQRTRVIHVRLFDSEYEEIARKVKESGLTMSEFVRRAANHRVIVSRIDEHVINELRRQGGLLKHVHAESGGAYSELTAEAIREIRDAVRRIEAGK